MAIVGAEETLKKISSQIESQFPGFVREEGPRFVAFLKAYFEYMEQEGNSVYAARSITDNQDIDRTVDSFVEYFRKEFMINIPSSVLADKRMLAKHIREFYRTRGSQESYRFLFRALFNSEIDFYYPGDDILRASDGRWKREIRLRVAAPFKGSPREFEGKRIQGVTSGATAYVQDVLGTISVGIEVFDMTIENQVGSFLDGERVFSLEDPTKFATISSQSGPIIDVVIKKGGAYHNINDSIQISGAGSTEIASARVTEVDNKSAVTAKIVKGGSGYTKEGTEIIVTGGNGQEFEAVVESWSRETIAGLSINTDLIGPMRNVRLNTPSFFVRRGANTARVTSKLSGTVSTSLGSNTITGVGTDFVSQLSAGDIVRIYGVANTARVYAVTNTTSFISTFQPLQAVTGANAYIGLAAANVSTTLARALTFSDQELYSINSIAIINPGYGYNTTLPTIKIVDTVISPLNISDGYGGVYGNNVVVTTSNAPGAIRKIRIVSPGADFSRYELAILSNETQSNGIIHDSYASSNTSGSTVTKYTGRQKTFAAAGLPVPSGIVKFPGRYIDTKGFLSWDKKLQDNFYYQEFSYVVRVTELLNKYKEIVKSLLHPAGTKMFADYTIIGSAVEIEEIVDSAPIVVRRSVRERITLTTTQDGPVNYANTEFAESITAAETESATFIANTQITEAATADESPDATYIANTHIAEAVTVTETPDGTYIANTFAVESTTVTSSESVTYVANTQISESVTSAESQDSTYTANTQITEAVTADEVPDVTYTANTQITEAATADDAPDVTYTANTQITEAATTVDVPDVTYIANTEITEAVTTAEIPDSTFVANTDIAESVSSTVVHQGQRFVYMSGVYADVQYANNQIQQYASLQIAPYSSIPINVFDGTPRLVTSNTAFFANGVLQANTGSINVGGIGTNVYIITVPGIPDDGSTVYNVNAIFSNTAFTIRQNFTGAPANTQIWYSSGP